MARITVEDCLKNVENRFALIHLAAKRVRQLRKGAEPLVQAKNKDVVIALREIAAGKIYPVSKDEFEQLRQGEADIEPESLPEPGEISEKQEAE
ncbi:MAG: DNA-directed RNA polymerase subunit omega [Deltaproteobacteria bacterium]|nr:DNA-directed RNA polymerase subunit omega [Deltaproteobacteria bacterium]MBW2081728.1 DNA-directed RNA polymerase subunit omega [Deltaproteobacteria bacterium]RLB85771.1 MAG: DNA-directed RNA polymerase subunit omega [Deltaproteobacteria bacterium]HDM09350.1 DNA-directed RNA polymerase subunit omega [Desulfobacteraceae bacterium]